MLNARDPYPKTLRWVRFRFRFRVGWCFSNPGRRNLFEAEENICCLSTSLVPWLFFRDHALIFTSIFVSWLLVLVSSLTLRILHFTVTPHLSPPLQHPGISSYPLFTFPFWVSRESNNNLLPKLLSCLSAIPESFQAPKIENLCYMLLNEVNCFYSAPLISFA